MSVTSEPPFARFAGIGGKVLEKLGASVTMVPGGEIYQALERKTIDATEFSQPAIDKMLGLDQIIKNYIMPGWHSNGYLLRDFYKYD